MTWHLVLMAVFYILAGLNHFVLPRFYRRMVPPYLPWPHTINVLSGIAEVILGLMLLHEGLRPIAAVLIIAMLVVFLTVHIHMLQDRNVVPLVPGWLLWLRLFGQFVLIYWAWLYV